MSLLETKLLIYLHNIDNRQRWLEYDGNRWRGTKALFDKGIKVCHECGYMLPIERNYCKCGVEVFIDYLIVETAPEPLPIPKAVRRKTGQKIKKGVLAISI